MKLIKLSATALACALVFGFASCRKTETKTDTKVETETETETEESDVVTTEALSFELKSAKKYYEITDPGFDEKYLLSLEATVQWPVEIGDYDLQPLQDKIMNLVGGRGMESIDDAMTFYVNDTAHSLIGSDKAHFKAVDSISSATDPRSFFKQIEVSFAELSSELITFNIAYDQYIGGAHGNSGATSLTYNLETQQFITTKWLFTDPTSTELIDAIKSAIAEASGMTVSELKQSALSNPIPISDNVSIKNGMIVFHYNPYSVLPYSYGAIDAQLSPYLLQNLLTPQAKELLISE